MAKNKIKILFIAFITLVIFLAGGGFLFFQEISSFIKEPFNPLAAGKVFSINPGQNLTVIAKTLKTNPSYQIRHILNYSQDTKKPGGNFRQESIFSLLQNLRNKFLKSF